MNSKNLQKSTPFSEHTTLLQTSGESHYMMKITEKKKTEIEGFLKQHTDELKWRDGVATEMMQPMRKAYLLTVVKNEVIGTF